MDAPQGVWRRSLEQKESIQASLNLANLDSWPSWNTSAQRVLSESTGSLHVGQRFDLHRIERQRLIEEMWEVSAVRQGDKPKFIEMEFDWLGQQREGKAIGTSLKSLKMSVTVLCESEGGIEIAAWWAVSRWSRFFRGRVNAQARAFAAQWLHDLSGPGTESIGDSQPLAFVQIESEDSKTVGDDDVR